MLNQSQAVKPNRAVTVPEVTASVEIDSLAERIRTGEAHLRVIAYPWGVEFEVCESSLSSEPAG